MKGLVLSGGTGTRLRPITHTSAKQLIPIANKPVLFYVIEALKDAGITDIGIVVGETKEEVKEAVGDGSQFGVKVTYIEQEAPLGLAHAVKISRDFLGDEDFVMFLGDNLIKDGICEFVDEFKEGKPNSLILLAQVDNPRQFGVAELKDGKVVNLIEKPEEPPSNLALVGVYLFDKSVFEAVENIKPSWRGELEITDAIQYLIDHGYVVKPHIIKGWWKDTGKLEDILEANRIMLEEVEREIKGEVDGKSSIVGRVVVEEGAEVKESMIRGPAIIGRNSKIERSYIGPFTSIYYDVAVKCSEIEHSVILEGVKIENIPRIEDSLVGKYVEIKKVEKRPWAYRLMLGDQSRVEIP
jgi:glucose-1-phosphate thymidylyltransferase